MNWWDLFTWAAIIVLLAGSSAVFVWFLRDLRRVLPPYKGRDKD